MTDHPVTLETLYRQLEVLADGGVAGSDSSAAQRAIVTRLLDNRSVARKAGWSSFKFRRRNGTGRIYLEGTPPGGRDRAVLPDWLGAPQPDRYQRSD